MKTIFNTTCTAIAVSLSGAALQTASTVDIAVGNKSFSRLVAAVTAAGLVDTIASSGPFTVYARVKDAFAAFPEGTFAPILQSENKG